jgi:hypothetical protein
LDKKETYQNFVKGIVMKLHVRKVRFIALVMAIMFYSVATAEEQASTAGKEADDFRNKFSLFGGMTQESSDHGASVGLEYEYRLGSYLGRRRIG